jgi:hypothetical protein
LAQERKPISKRTRFEIFKRDGFTCQYCGRKPPEIVLEVDHIEPVSSGGENHKLNLVTSCEDCNSGKSDKLLADFIPRPDADAALLEAQQEIAEARRFLVAHEERKKLNADVVEQLREYWFSVIPGGYGPTPQELLIFLGRCSPDEIYDGIGVLANSIASGTKLWSIQNRLKYLGGIIRRRREEGQNG